MSGDYTRDSFHPERAFAAVLKQQGRVSTDADFNELIELIDRRWRAETVDIIGCCAVPRSTPDGFKLVLDASAGGGYTLGRGRAYVDGLQAECRGDPTAAKVTFDPTLGEDFGGPTLAINAQPFMYSSVVNLFPDPFTVPAATPSLAYLDVWEREVDVISEPALREVAIGGPDTTTRLQTAWQVKFADWTGKDGDCPQPDDPTWLAITAPSTVRLTTDTITPPPDPDPCIIEPEGGYTGLENRLYRVEIHEIDATRTSAWFKYSRDNASLESAVLGLAQVGATPDWTIDVSSVGRDRIMRFAIDDYVELVDDRIEFAARDSGHGGPFVRITAVDELDGRLTVRDAGVAPLSGTIAQFKATFASGRHPRVRRWDVGLSTDPVLVKVDGVVHTLEHGVQVTFSGTGGAAPTFHAGDFWVFAARTAIGTIEKLKAAPPRGIHHHFCPIGTVGGPSAPKFAQFILQTGTALHETDATFDFAFADWNGDGKLDLIAIKKSNTGSSSTEVHVLSGASNYQQFILQTGTALHETDATFDFAFADWNGDGKLDLIAIKKSNTGSSSTEVHVLSGASNYQQFILQTGTALHETDATFDFAFADWNGDGKLDLIAIKKSNTGSSSTEVHVLSGASNYQQFILQTGTALHETDATFDFAFADWNGDGKLDLIAIKKSNTGSSSTEVHVLSGASNYQQFILQTGTALHETDATFDFAFADWNGDGKLDLIAIKKSNTGSSSTEVHVLSGASLPEDCRTLWPPECHDDGGCECDVCISAPPPGHDATGVIQAGIDAVRDTGGTVCLGAGIFLVDGPIKIDGARSVRLTGKGWKTVLVSTGADPVIAVTKSVGLEIRELSVVGSGVGIAIENSVAVLLERCAVIEFAGLTGLVATMSNVGGAAGGTTAPSGPAVALSGIVALTRIRDNVLVGASGIDVAEEGKYLLLANTAIEDNVLATGSQGIDLHGLTIYIADTRIERNLVAGCEAVGIRTTGFCPDAAIPGSGIVIDANTVVASGNGILFDTDGSRVSDNTVRILGSQTYGVLLESAEDQRRPARVVVVGNRIRNGAIGIVCKRLGSGIIDANIIDGPRDAGIAADGDPETSEAWVRDNRIADVAGQEDGGRDIRGIVVAELGRARIDRNVVVAMGAMWQGGRVIGIEALGCADVVIANNDLSEMAVKADQLTASAGIRVERPFRRVDVVDNVVRRAAGPDPDAAPATGFIAIQIEGEVPDVDKDVQDMTDKMTAAGLADIWSSSYKDITGQGKVRTRLPRRQPMASVRGNHAESPGSSPAIEIQTTGLAMVADNRCRLLSAERTTVLVVAGATIVTDNFVEGPKTTPAIVVFLPTTGANTILGNIVSGPIEVHGGTPFPLLGMGNILAN